MKQTQERITVGIDGYTRLCLTAIAVLLTILIIGLWSNAGFQPARSAAAATAPEARPDRTILPNAAAQRLAIIKAIQTTNKRLDKIATLLTSGKVQVVLVDAGGDKAVKNVKPKK